VEKVPGGKFGVFLECAEVEKYLNRLLFSAKNISLNPSIHSFNRILINIVDIFLKILTH